MTRKFQFQTEKIEALICNKSREEQIEALKNELKRVSGPIGPRFSKVWATEEQMETASYRMDVIQKLTELRNS